MEEPGEQCTNVVFALIVTEPASERVCGGSVTIYAKTTVQCSPDSSMVPPQKRSSVTKVRDSRQVCTNIIRHKKMC